MAPQNVKREYVLPKKIIFFLSFFSVLHLSFKKTKKLSTDFTSTNKAKVLCGKTKSYFFFLKNLKNVKKKFVTRKCFEILNFFLNFGFIEENESKPGHGGRAV